MQESQTGLCAPKRVARVVRAGTRPGTSWLKNCRGGGFLFHVGPPTALAYIMRSTCNFARDKLRVAPSGLEKHSVSATAVYATQSVLWGSERRRGCSCAGPPLRQDGIGDLDVGPRRSGPRSVLGRYSTCSVVLGHVFDPCHFDVQPMSGRPG